MEHPMPDDLCSVCAYRPATVTGFCGVCTRECRPDLIELPPMWCTEEGCDAQAPHGGRCMAHYQPWHEDPAAGGILLDIAGDAAERFCGGIRNKRPTSDAVDNHCRALLLGIPYAVIAKAVGVSDPAIFNTVRRAAERGRPLAIEAKDASRSRRGFVGRWTYLNGAGATERERMAVLRKNIAAERATERKRMAVQRRNVLSPLRLDRPIMDGEGSLYDKLAEGSDGAWADPVFDAVAERLDADRYAERSEVHAWNLDHRRPRLWPLDETDFSLMPSYSGGHR